MVNLYHIWNESNTACMYVGILQKTTLFVNNWFAVAEGFLTKQNSLHFCFFSWTCRHINFFIDWLGVLSFNSYQSKSFLVCNRGFFLITGVQDADFLLNCGKEG